MPFSPQVSSEHYDLDRYVTHERWNSYLNQVKEILRIRPESVLIVGPGDPIISSILRGYKISVKTVDIDPTNNPDYLVSVDEIGNVVKENFDVILCSQVLEHLPLEKFENSVKVLYELSRKLLIISLPEKSFRISIALKIPKFKMKYLYVVIPFLFWKHKFNGQHYWELNARGTSVHNIVSKLNKVCPSIRWYRLASNPYQFFFLLSK